MLSAPTSTAPAASSRSISVASRGAGGTLAVDLRAGARRQSLRHRKVLDRKGHAGERADIEAGRDGLVDPVRALSRTLGDDIGEGVELWIALRDPRERGFDDLRRAQSGAATPLLRSRRRGSSMRVQASEDRRGLGFVGQREISSTSRAMRMVTSRLAAHRRLPGSSIASPSEAATRIDKGDRHRFIVRLWLTLADIRLEFAAVFRSAGAESPSADSRVYCSFGAPKTSFGCALLDDPPARITMTRSHNRRTTLRSCETNR